MLHWNRNTFFVLEKYDPLQVLDVELEANNFPSIQNRIAVLLIKRRVREKNCREHSVMLRSRLAVFIAALAFLCKYSPFCRGKREFITTEKVLLHFVLVLPIKQKETMFLNLWR